MSDLPKLVQALPTELFDQIYENTFTHEQSTQVINKAYKPSHLLQVDRASRSLFAISYYGRTLYTTDDPYERWTINKQPECCMWLKSLPAEHLNMIREIHLLSTERGTVDARWCTNNNMQIGHIASKLAQARISLLVLRLKTEGFEVSPIRIRSRVRIEDVGGDEVVSRWA